MEPNDTILGHVVDLRERMVRIETKIDEDRDKRKEDRKDHEELKVRVEAQDLRIGKLESLQRLFVWIGTAAIFVLTFLQDWITDKLF